MNKVTYLISKREPVMAAAVVLSVALTAVGIIVDPNTLMVIMTVVVPILLGLLTRTNVISEHTLDEIEKAYHALL